MQLRSLELFCRVAELRSFSKAADAFELTQSAVSQSIGHLERSLGTRLIDRSSRPLKLTDAGQDYLLGVRDVIRQYHDLELRVRHRGERLQGSISIGAIYSIGLSYMPEATAAFDKNHPDLVVRTEFGTSERVVEMVREGRVDFGLVSFPKRDKTLRFIAWQSEPMRLVCSAQHPLAKFTEIVPEQLAGAEMVGFQRDLKIRKAVDQCLKRAGISVDTSMEFDNADSMVRAIQASHGIGIVPEAVVRRETATGMLRVVACQQLRMVRPLGIIFRRQVRLSRAATEFGSLLLGRDMEAELNQASRGDRPSSARRKQVKEQLNVTSPPRGTRQVFQ